MYLIERDTVSTKEGWIFRPGLGWSKPADLSNAPQLMPLRFRIYDADGVLYYEGRSSGESFAPLDWATAYAGATRIDYLQADGRWETL